MWIDVLFLLLIVVGAVRGFFRGLILAICSLVAYLVGLAAAMKCSHLVAERLQPYLHISSKWLPFIAFLLIFLVVILLVRLMAMALQKVTEGMMLGWANRLGGMLFYCILYATIFSILLFYLVNMHLIAEDTLQHSITYPYISEIAPKLIGCLGICVPWFRDIFAKLEKFFDKVGA